MFGIKDADSPIEFMSWNAKVRCRLRDGFKPKLVTSRARQEVLPSRRIYLAGRGWVEAAVYDFEGLRRGTTVKGPAIVESAFATVVVDEKSEAKRQHSGSLAISIGS
ncbi:MAG: hypothetical protein IH786_09500 [Proteobacteria bacterium]|nr:hypothetical protein [Pseudomonadota bacterium]